MGVNELLVAERAAESYRGTIIGTVEDAGLRGNLYHEADPQSGYVPSALAATIACANTTSASVAGA